MKPKNSDTNNYVGIEVECYGTFNGLSDSKLKSNIEALSKKLKGCVEIGRDSSISVNCFSIDVNWTNHFNGTFVAEPRIQHLCIEDENNWNTIVNEYGNDDNQEKLKALLEEYTEKVNEDGEGKEIRLLVKQDDVSELVPKIYEYLNSIGTKVNNSCGLHIHLDMRNRNPARAYRNLTNTKELLFKLNPDRRDIEYCEDVSEFKGDDAEFYERLEYTEKYECINRESLKELGTLEVRMGKATMDGDTVASWINLLVNICDRVEPPKKYKSFVSYFTHLGLPKSVADKLKSVMYERNPDMLKKKTKKKTSKKKSAKKKVARKKVAYRVRRKKATKKVRRRSA